MSKAQLIFDLTDEDDRYEFMCATKGKDALFALYDIGQLLRRYYKNDTNPTIEDLRNEFAAILDDREINLDNL